MALFHVQNEDRIKILANELQWPDWLVEATAIEYLPCRRFISDRHWVQFDFSLLSADQFRALATPLVVLNNYTLFHNVTWSVVGQRLLRGLAGSPIVPISPNVLMPNGKVSPHYQAMRQNDPSVWDMKLGTGLHAIIIDGDSVFQWQLYSLPGQPANQVLKPESHQALKHLHDKVYAYAKMAFPQNEQESPKIREGLEALYREIDAVRATIRNEVIEHHDNHQQSVEAHAAFCEEQPVTITVFDEPGVVEHKLVIRSFVEPLFFRSAHRASERARKFAESRKKDSAAFWITEEVEAAAECITLSMMCLEAFINGVIREKCESLWDSLEKIEAKAKWLIVPQLLGVTDCFDTGAMPFQRFSELVKWRNSLVHYKHAYRKPVEVEGERISELYSTCNAKNAQKAVSTIVAMTQRLCSQIGMPEPRWIENNGGWLDVFKPD